MLLQVLHRKFRSTLRGILSLFLVGVVLAGAVVSAQAQTLPPQLRELYKASDLDPDNNPCLTGHIPATPDEHAARQKCMVQEYIRHGEPAGQSEVPGNHLRAYIGQAQMMESAASFAELQYLQSGGAR